MNEYELLIETINPCGGEAHSKKEFLEITAASPEEYVARNGRYPVLDSGKNALHVNAVMLVEAFVFCRNQGLEEYGRDGVVGYRRAILVEEFAQHFPVSTVDFRSCRCFGMNDVLNGRRLPEKPKKVENDGESVEHPKSDE